jgi:hypothetical protein
MIYFFIFIINWFSLISENLNIKKFLFFNAMLLIILLVLFNEIGGDYESQINRAEYLYNNNIFADPVSFIASFLQHKGLIDSPKLFSICSIVLLFILGKTFKINYYFISIGLVFIYINIITGFHRQSLSIMIFLISIYYLQSKKYLKGIFILIFSILTHAWILFLLPIYCLSSRIIKLSWLSISLFLIMVSIIYQYRINIEIIIDNTIIGHFIKNYIVIPMKSDGAIYRIFYSLLSFSIIYKKKIKYMNFEIQEFPRNSFFYELLILSFYINISSILLFIIGNSTASDRILLINYLIYPIILSFYNIKKKIIYYYILSLAYFLFWINLSNHAIRFW